MTDELFVRINAHRILMAMDQHVIVPKEMYDILRLVPEAQSEEVLTDLFMTTRNEYDSNKFADMVEKMRGNHTVQDQLRAIEGFTRLWTMARERHPFRRRAARAVVCDAITTAAKSAPRLKLTNSHSVFAYMHGRVEDDKTRAKLEAIYELSPGAVFSEWVMAYDGMDPVGAVVHGVDMVTSTRENPLKLVYIIERARGFGYEELPSSYKP